MAWDSDEVIEYYLQNARKMDPIYAGRLTMGMRKEIPFKDHKPVRVLVNMPRKERRSKAVYINIHGGAFAEGDAVTMDSFCQTVADALGILVCNLNYTLFPESYFPYPIQELDALYRYLIGNANKLGIDPERIAVGGFSAGATIAFGHEIQLLEKGDEGYRCILGGYPMTSGRPEDVDTNSGYAATANQLSQAMDMAMGEWINKPICSCLLAPDDILQKIKGAIIFYCGRDSLGSMGRKFALRLVNNGVPTYVREFANAYHGFLEVNRPDYFMPDARKNEEQKKYCSEAEKFLIDGLSIML